MVMLRRIAQFHLAALLQRADYMKEHKLLRDSHYCKYFSESGVAQQKILVERKHFFIHIQIAKFIYLG